MALKKVRQKSFSKCFVINLIGVGLISTRVNFDFLRKITTIRFLLYSIVVTGHAVIEPVRPLRRFTRGATRDSLILADAGITGKGCFVDHMCPIRKESTPECHYCDRQIVDIIIIVTLWGPSRWGFSHSVTCLRPY